MFRINISNREYTECSMSNTLSSKQEEVNFNPIEFKLLNQDIFEFREDKPYLLHSTVRKMTCIPGILAIENNKVYGKTKKGRNLYKCVPDDTRFPIFLIPYTLKLGFSKKIYNKYVIFKFSNWDSKHPLGTLVNVLGDVSILDHFYEYQLYCKSLYASIQQFTKITMQKLRDKSEDYFIKSIMDSYDITDRTAWNIISIDPKNSKDFDDAFSIKSIDKNTYLLSIYIANVALWLDIMNIWDSFSNRIATIYLPDRRRPMLPTILSDALCSLQEKQKRFAFTMDILIDKNTGEIKNINYLNTCIKVTKNLRYNTNQMRTNKTYLEALILTKMLNKKNKYLDSVTTGHDVVAYLMILMNFYTAKLLVKKEKGIFRSVKANSSFKIPTNLPESVTSFLKIWNSFGGKYSNFCNLESHDMFHFDAYVHITSPIRRLVDLLNIIIIQKELGLFKFNKLSKSFHDKWTCDEKIEYINKTMKSIRKVQNDCSLLKMCSTDKEITTKIHVGYIFDKLLKNSGLFQYMVYFPQLKMNNRFTNCNELENNIKRNFKLYIFTDETRLKKKIRIELID